MSQKLETILDTYAFNPQQKNQLRIADTKKLDVSYLANPDLDWEQMREIIICMEYEIDPAPLCNPSIPSEDLEQLREHLFKLNGVYEKAVEDVSKKRTRRIIITAIVSLILLAIIFIVYVNRQYLSYYLEDINLELTTDRIELNMSDTFIASNYIKDYDHEYDLEMPTLKNDIPGEFQLTYKLSNQVKTTTKTLIVIVMDNIVPIIELKQQSISIEAGSNINFKDYIVSAVDNVDGDITNKLRIFDIPDVSLPGEYQVKYSVADKEGNLAEVVLKVSINGKNIVLPPTNNNSTGSNSGSSIDATNSNPSAIPPTGNVQIKVTADAKEFYNENPLIARDEAVEYGKSMLNQRKANGYDCDAIYDAKTGLAVGYKTTFH